MDLLARQQPPSLVHWFGTDQMGRDLWLRAFQGSLTSLELGISTALCSGLLAMVAASLSLVHPRCDAAVRLVIDAMLALPEVISTKPKHYDRELKGQVDALRLSDDFYTVIGGQNDEGAVLISHTSDRVDFWEYLGDRTINIIPVDTLDEVLDVVDAYTQTVGVWPQNLWDVVAEHLQLRRLRGSRLADVDDAHAIDEGEGFEVQQVGF